MIHMYKFTYAIKSMPSEVPLQIEKQFISNYFAALDLWIVHHILKITRYNIKTYFYGYIDI